MSRDAPWKGGVVAGAALVAVLLLLPDRNPIVSVPGGDAVAGVSLHFPLAYLVLAPVCGILDHLTLLTVPEHLAVLATLMLVFLAWRLVRLRGPRVPRRGPLARAAIELAAFLGFLAVVVGVYGYGAVGPRPMAELEVTDPDVVVVDFHSHTGMSHDGRRSFTAAVNRAWHRDAGFDVAWITDHDSVRAAIEAEARNPATAGEGTVILVGREVVYRDEHVAVLGTVDPRVEPAPGDARVEGAAPATECADRPLMIQTIPENLDKVPVPGPDGCPVVHAIEISDGAPRGIDQGEREQARILRIADSLHLALVAASNNHGWGRTAVAWSLVRIPGWRTMAPRELGARIEGRIRADGPRAVRVVARRRQPRTGGGLRVAAPFLSVVTLFGGLTRPERLAWLLWVGAALWLAGRRKRQLGAAEAQGET